MDRLEASVHEERVTGSLNMSSTKLVEALTGAHHGLVKLASSTGHGWIGRGAGGYAWPKKGGHPKKGDIALLRLLFRSPSPRTQGRFQSKADCGLPRPFLVSVGSSPRDRVPEALEVGDGERLVVSFQRPLIADGDFAPQ